MKTFDDRNGNEERGGEEREQRWIAYFLGECDEQERQQTERELAQAPELARQYETLAGGLRRWANEPVSAAPLSIDAIEKAARQQARIEKGAREAKRAPGRRLMAAGWFAAAAALLLVAISQTHFTLSLGNTTLRWNTAEPQTVPDLGAYATQADIEKLRTLTASLAQNVAQTDESLQVVAWNSQQLQSAFQATATKLVRQQELESYTRYQDMQSVMQLAGIGASQPWSDAPVE